MIKKLIISMLVLSMFVLTNGYTYLTTKANWYVQGINDGNINARAEIIDELKKYFDMADSSISGRVVFSSKTTDVIVFTKNGIQTIAILSSF